jgi:beta-N-acetylhexosaminidase
MSLGPIMLDLEGVALAPEERELLHHPLVGGVILFARNYASVPQLCALVSAIHEVRDPKLMVAVDHEGGRVQRFREGFTRLPACALIGKAYDENHKRGLHLAEKAGWVMAVELRAAGVDFSFAPVLDLHKGISRVIGDRSFHRDPEIVANLARQYIHGMRRVGMEAVGKHFPGHGSVIEDSHHAVPIDRRSFEDIQLEDLLPFERLITAGLAAVMPAHVIYPAVDERPAGFSPVWLQDILRRQLNFHGTIFSDDICMAGAEVAGNHTDRAHAALHAGCDMVLVCNNRKAVIDVLDNLKHSPDPAAQVRLIRMHGRNPLTFAEMQQDREWQKNSREIAALEMMPELNLGDDDTA